MDKKDISLLVLNSIKDEKRIIDNYDFYNDTDSEGLNSDFLRQNAIWAVWITIMQAAPALKTSCLFAFLL